MLTVHVRRHGSLQRVPQTSGRTALEKNGIPTTAPIFLTSVQVAVHKTHEQQSTSQTGHFGTDINGQSHVKPHELTVGFVGDYGTESDSEKCVV